MTQAYILVQTEVGRASFVANLIKDFQGITSVEVVSGPYDIIIRAQASDETALRSDILSEIQHIDHVTRTLTCHIVDLE